ncbi:MAG TPA: DUF2794 domain-containing protein [Terriglobia bacterium]|nr:DUF2794 domain-containing protein [Terriglobia bacterium]
MSQLVLLADYQRKGRRVFFNRTDLNLLLAIYSRQVGRGLWRDYAIDHRSNMAIFSIYRRSQEQPLFAINKVILKGGKDANYILLSRNRQLASSRQLADVIETLSRQLAVVE